MIWEVIIFEIALGEPKHMTDGVLGLVAKLYFYYYYLSITIIFNITIEGHGLHHQLFKK